MRKLDIHPTKFLNLIVVVIALMSPVLLVHYWNFNFNKLDIYAPAFLLAFLLTIVTTIIGIIRKNVMRLTAICFIFSSVLFLCIVNFQYSRNKSAAEILTATLTVYKNENGKYPAQLSMLSPKYLKKIPSEWAGLRVKPFSYNCIYNCSDYQIELRSGHKTTEIWYGSMGVWQFLD